MFLVDTNVISEYQRKSRPAVAWFRKVDETSIFLSVITFGEITRGIVRKQSKDREAAARLAVWLDSLKADFANRTFLVDGAVASQWGRIAAKRSRNIADGLIAATAVVHELTLVTRNVADFADLSIPLVNPWHSAND